MSVEDVLARVQPKYESNGHDSEGIVEPDYLADERAEAFAAPDHRDDLTDTFEDRVPLPTIGLLPPEFWTTRPALEQIRQAAHSRQRAPAAVLHAVLARIAALSDHTVEIPAIVGAAAPLCYFAALLAKPGVGKSNAHTIGAELLPIPEGLKVADQLPPGSGEGLVEALYGTVDELGEDGKTHKVRRQVIHNACLYLDEGTALVDLGARAGSTLASTLRTIWSGGPLGNANANEDRRRHVPAGQYVYGLTIALQTLRANALLGDVDAGLPQRFGWASATDPTLPDVAPDWPGLLAWQPPTLDDQGATYNASGYRRHPLAIAPEIVAEIRADDLARVRGVAVADDLDAHGGLLRIKIAGGLAILDGRLDVNLEDWRLAGMVKHASDQVRTQVVGANAAQERRREAQTADRLAGRAVVTADALDHRQSVRKVDCARKIARKVHDEPDRWAFATLRRNMRRYRDCFADAFDIAVDEDWVVEHAATGQGTDQRALRPGNRRPK